MKNLCEGDNKKMGQIKLTIVPTEKRDSFGDVVYDIEMDDDGYPGVAEGK